MKFEVDKYTGTVLGLSQPAGLPVHSGIASKELYFWLEHYYFQNPYLTFKECFICFVGKTSLWPSHQKYQKKNIKKIPPPPKKEKT